MPTALLQQQISLLNLLFGLTGRPKMGITDAVRALYPELRDFSGSQLRKNKLYFKSRAHFVYGLQKIEGVLSGAVSQKSLPEDNQAFFQALRENLPGKTTAAELKEVIVSAKPGRKSKKVRFRKEASLERPVLEGDDGEPEGDEPFEVSLREISEEVEGEIRRIPIIPHEELVFLFQILEVAPPDETTLRGRIVRSNLRLVNFWAWRAISHRFVGSLTFEDLRQEGSIGLLHAVAMYKWRKGYKFSTYASWWIRQYIHRAIADKAHLIRLPVHVSDTAGRHSRARNELQQEFGRDPLPEEIAQKMELSQEKVTKLEKAIRKQKTSSLDEIVEEESDHAYSLYDIMSSARTETTESSDAKEDLLKALDRLESLPDGARLRKVLELRFGLKDNPTRTLEEVGRMLGGLTRERVRQLEAKALRLLRKDVSLQDYVDSRRALLSYR